MSSGENKLIRRRLAGAWLSSVISISLVLLLVGVASLLLINAKSVSDYFKENVQISVLMGQDVTEDQAMDYATTLDAMPFIKGTRFISKEEGTRDMKDMLGEDFLNVFETAPIPPLRMRVPSSHDIYWLLIIWAIRVPSSSKAPQCWSVSRSASCLDFPGSSMRP